MMILSLFGRDWWCLVEGGELWNLNLKFILTWIKLQFKVDLLELENGHGYKRNIEWFGRKSVKIK